ncbi:unnamed protein product [Schistocephalus solidus]|uniref:YTH domain-containing protein n=1 Tax=Schistocephalus solidus TaxID=70667 RepID=A0A183SW54_SCHSO|nr:unnamed protein product [Schistocephalus solidus]
MSGLHEINMSFQECLTDAKARLVMVAFVKFNDEDNAEVMKILEEISNENKRLVILAVDATKNILGSRVTTKENKLKKDIEKYSKVYVATPDHKLTLKKVASDSRNVIFQVDMCLDECLISAKARLVMVAFVDLKDEDNAEVMKLLEGISHEHKRLVILVVNARKNLGLVQQFNIVACPTFVFFRSRQLVSFRT